MNSSMSPFVPLPGNHMQRTPLRCSFSIWEPSNHVASRLSKYVYCHILFPSRLILHLYAGSFLVRFSSCIPSILTDVFHDFPHYFMDMSTIIWYLLNEIVIVWVSSNKCLDITSIRPLWLPFRLSQFIIHHSTVYVLRRRINQEKATCFGFQNQNLIICSSNPIWWSLKCIRFYMPVKKLKDLLM